MVTWSTSLHLIMGIFLHYWIIQQYWSVLQKGSIKLVTISSGCYNTPFTESLVWLTNLSLFYYSHYQILFASYFKKCCAITGIYVIYHKCSYLKMLFIWILLIILDQSHFTPSYCLNFPISRNINPKWNRVKSRV